MRRAERPARGENCSCARTFARSLGGGGVKPSTKALLLGLAVLLALAAAWAVSIAQAQNDDKQTGRIVARRLDDGRTEFGWQPAGGERVLPSARYFPADAQVDRWLNSSTVEVGGAEIGRINARLLDDGRIEFAFTPTDGERIEPPARYFPTDARTNRWLRSTEIAISAAPATGFVAVSAGVFHNCAIRTNGAIKCWGSDYAGQLLDAPTGSFTAVSVGGGHACAIRESGAIACWGFGGGGQTDAPAGAFRAVSAGNAHTCAIRDTGAIECWGSNHDWQGNYVGQIDAPAGAFRAVSAGAAHTCAIRESGAIECWGSNTTSNRNPFTEEHVTLHLGQADAPPGSFSAVSAGAAHTCAIRESGEIACWGGRPANVEGQFETLELPTPPAGSFSAVAAGGETEPTGSATAYTCAIRAGSGAIECWGSYDRGMTNAPAGSFSAVSTGRHHACAIRDTGAIECWGRNDGGQTDVPTP